MNEHEFLMQFQKILNDEEYDCSIVEATDIAPYERLLVFLGLDEQERERILEVTVLKQELMKGMELQKSAGPDFFRIQFLVNLPVNIQPDACAQVGSLVCYLNRLIELPGFEMDEIDLKVIYRYVLMYGEEKFNKKLFISLVGFIMLTVELFASTLERVAKGETTFNALLEEIIAIAQQIKQ